MVSESARELRQRVVAALKLNPRGYKQIRHSMIDPSCNGRCANGVIAETLHILGNRGESSIYKSIDDLLEDRVADKIIAMNDTQCASFAGVGDYLAKRWNIT